MPDITTVRAEIKAWEREFRNNHHRDPSVQDIKYQPSIAEKYKLYKKLSKATVDHAPSAGQSSSHPPSTPPRSQTRPSRSGIITKPRAVEPVAPLPGFNPFSPVKDKGKKLDRSHLLGSSHAPKTTSNPFATPSKNKSKPPTHLRSVSPDPFPPIQPFMAASSSSRPEQFPAPNTAVSRARKRLRGEPVSPSPNKQKRQRVGSKTVLPFPRLTSPQSSDDDESDDGKAGLGEHNSSFVIDSPVKAPVGGKSFKLLFDDVAPSTALPKISSSLSRTQAKDNTDIAAFFADGDANDHAIREAAKQKGKINAARQNIGLKRGRSGRIDEKSSLNNTFPAREDAFSNNTSLSGSTSLRQTNITLTAQSTLSHSIQARSSTKRALHDEKLTSESIDQDASHARELSLLPPSPTPDQSSSSYRVQKKGKAPMASGRKKARVAETEEGGGEDEDDENSSGEVTTVKVVNRFYAQKTSENANALDWDPILSYSAHNHDPQGDRGTDLASHQETGTFQVDLPDKFRLVLAISPSRRGASKEEHVVRGLLHGSRVGHYDASKGGDIWEVGEGDEDTRIETEGEDDWEGEPVPWEVGEL
ncbi:DNA replication and checkpoint protein-domain-containing protein [Hygrophoropsis aurantiaca]|uniref:DNA replication and checkpoint protein-domain-containing protein n=1 Tax=Hygrophoropsis aurantiaca TaxID=72124 RepID=A0ACB8ANN7_9AGAM|nr:DNA replication and checkpoint protein-domain-containing protein [Hygrophoropsis aurantiaca]